MFGDNIEFDCFPMLGLDLAMGKQEVEDWLSHRITLFFRYQGICLSSVFA